MKKLLLSFLVLVGALPFAYAVIYRHDVAEEKYRALGAQPQFDCVGKILDRDNRTDIGSCVLIADRYVLTAAHVMIESDMRKDTVMHDGKQIIVFVPVNRHVADPSQYTFRFNRRRYEGKSIKILPAYMDSVTKGQCDIALIELAEPVTNVKPALLCNTFDELHSLVTGVGYGASGNASIPEEVDIYGYKLAGQNIIDTLQGYLYNGKPALLGFDFDHPVQPQYNLMGSSKPISLEYLCGGGDSGGGMFRQNKKGIWELVGICSGAGIDVDKLMKIGYYGHAGKYTRVSVFHSWIEQSIQEFEQKRLSDSK